MLKTGEKIGEYVVVRHIDRGGFGDVWRVEKRAKYTTTQFALKLFHLQNERSFTFNKIKKEIRISQKLSGLPHIISVIEADKHQDCYVYIISEYADGGSLRKWLSKNGGKAPSYEEAIKITSEILKGLEYMDGQKVVHRDLKPENILKKKEVFCLADFGISREIKTYSRATGRAGTYEYMPPEAFELKPSVSVHTDIWAVGVILQELLTGNLPFPQPLPALFNAVLNGEPEPMPEDIPEFLREIVKKALQKERENRFQSAQEMREAIENRQPLKITGRETIIDETFEEAKLKSLREPENSSLTNSIGMEFVEILPGTFLMGSLSEVPVHQVTISYKFQMGKHTVTQGQWKSVMGRIPTKCDDGSLSGEMLGDDKPVVCVSWYDAQEFATLLSSKKDGFIYRLPTEAEWEYACRAGSPHECAGDLDLMAWYGNNSEKKIHPVGEKQPNAWGLYDMHGNVWEWVQDWHWNYTKDALTDPTGPSEGFAKVYRGGSWFSPAEYCFSASRGNYSPASCDIYLGFRLVRVYS